MGTCALGLDYPSPASTRGMLGGQLSVQGRPLGELTVCGTCRCWACQRCVSPCRLGGGTPVEVQDNELTARSSCLGLAPPQPLLCGPFHPEETPVGQVHTTNRYWGLHSQMRWLDCVPPSSCVGKLVPHAAGLRLGTSEV